MPSQALVFRKIEHSNLPARTKSALARWAEKHGGMHHAVRHHAKATTEGALHSLRQGGEGAIVGAALGALHVQLAGGLDVGPKKNIPLDGLVAAAGLIGSALVGRHEMAGDARNVGSSALAVLAFRKSYALMAKKAQEKGKAPGGTFTGEFGADIGEDPIIAISRIL